MSENNKDLTTSQKTEKVVKKEQKPGFLKRVGKWLHELKVEAKKVVWPNKKQVINNTAVTVATIVLVGVIVGGLDAVFSWIRNLIINIL